MSDSKNPLGILPGYYIDINSGPTMLSERYGTDKGVRHGKEYCYVTVYESLDRGYGKPQVEHTERVGKFKLDDLENKSFAEGLEMIREGIENIVNQEPEKCKLCKVVSVISTTYNKPIQLLQQLYKHLLC
ncbi:hypothetical protein ACFL0E_00185 [Nanoarchaeota archaeon]